MSNLFQEFSTHQNLVPTAPPINPVLGRSTSQQRGSQDSSAEEASDDNVGVDYNPADPESDGLDSDEEEEFPIKHWPGFFKLIRVSPAQPRSLNAMEQPTTRFRLRQDQLNMVNKDG